MVARMKTHPIADLFPMMADDELQDLAADIKERGLLQPVVRDTEGRILDGRNRYAACKIAGVEPEYVTYEGDDPDGYALAVNIARRNMSKGQQAIVLARALRQRDKNIESIERDKGKVARQHGISPQYLAHANVILDYAADEADRILTTPPLQFFDEAYKLASANKKAKKEEADQLTALRDEAPDLADDVAEERVTFKDALVVLKQRRDDAERADEVAEIDALVDDAGGTAPNFTQRVEKGELTWTEALTLAKQWKHEYDESVTRHVNAIMRVNESWGYLAKTLTTPERIHSTDVLKQLGEADRHRLNEITTEITNLVLPERITGDE
jgi:hypothetical protein